MPSSDTLESSQSKPTPTTQITSTENLTALELDAIAVTFHYFVYPNLPRVFKYTPNRISADPNELSESIEYSRKLGLTEKQIDIVLSKTGMLSAKDDPQKHGSYTAWAISHTRYSENYELERFIRQSNTPNKFDSSKFETIKSDALGRTIK